MTGTDIHPAADVQACSIIPRHLAVEGKATQVIPCGNMSHATDPSIELTRDGDRIIAIGIRCACGNVTTILCNYE